MRCAVGCGFLQRGDESGRGLDDVRGDPSHPTTRGAACKRGIRETADPDGTRLKRPLVRRKGDLVATTWPNALERATAGIEAALERSPDAVAVLGSGQQTNEATYALGKLARGGFGTRHYDANTTLCMASAVTAQYDAFGSDGPPPTYDDIPNADTHLVWGANPAVSHPVLFRWITASATADGSQLLVVDPVESETVDHADVHVAPDPGGDLALARAILARIVERDEHDEAFIASHTTGFDALLEELPDPAAAAARAGVSHAAVDRLADGFRDRALVYWGMGVNQSVAGTATAGALIDCCLATGTLGPGSGPFSLTGQANSMGARVCSAKGTWPGQRPFADPSHRKTVAEVWGVPPSRLPAVTGPGPVGIVEAIDDAVEAVYAVATNPAAGLPDATRVRDRLEDAFLVVQDAFHSETVERADVVLPAATWGESEGTAMNMERTISRVRAATDTPHGVKTDLEIIGELATRVVPGLFEEPPTPEAVFEEIAALTAGTSADCSGVSYDRLEAELAVRWPAPTPDDAGGYRYHEGDPDGENDAGGPAGDGTGGASSWSFPTPSGRARFSDAMPRALPEPTDDRFPLTLTTARLAESYNTGVRARNDDLVARVHPRTATRTLDSTPPSALEGRSESMGTPSVRIRSRRGAVTAMLDRDSRVPEGVVWLPVHHPATNELTVPAVDPRSREPHYKQCAVTLEWGP